MQTTYPPQHNTVNARRQHTSCGSRKGKQGAGIILPLLTSNYTPFSELIESSMSVHQKINMAQRTHSVERPWLSSESVRLGETLAEILP